MRGPDTFTESLFTLRKLEDFVPADHPLRPIRQMVNAALVKMDALFSGIYEADAKGGRPSIAPEKLSRAMLLQVFCSIRSERQASVQAHKTDITAFPMTGRFWPKNSRPTPTLYGHPTQKAAADPSRW